MKKLSLNIRGVRALHTSPALKLPFALHPQIRLAQLDDEAPAFGPLLPFRPQSSADLEGFRPNIIVGSPRALQCLAEQAELGIVNLDCLDHAIVALTRCGHSPITDVERVVFWQAFGVPVYEVFTGLDNAILGYECELHEGWHLPSHVRFTEANGELLLEASGVVGLQTALSGSMTQDECPCGRSGRRLLNIEPIRRPSQKMKWAAIA